MTRQGFVPVVALVQEFGNAHPSIYRLVEHELKGRRVLHPQLGGHRLLQETVRRLEPGERLRALLVASEHGDVHLGLAQIGACVHRSHCHESYAWVPESLRESR